ncbi:MAG TPA: hypothetical protein VGD01_11235 [Candidatus Elarobacter sp.]|jgi:hypothetical protein
MALRRVDCLTRLLAPAVALVLLGFGPTEGPAAEGAPQRSAVVFEPDELGIESPPSNPATDAITSELHQRGFVVTTARAPNLSAVAALGPGMCRGRLGALLLFSRFQLDRGYHVTVHHNSTVEPHYLATGGASVVAIDCASAFEPRWGRGRNEQHFGWVDEPRGPSNAIALAAGDALRSVLQGAAQERPGDELPGWPEAARFGTACRAGGGPETVRLVERLVVQQRPGAAVAAVRMTELTCAENTVRWRSARRRETVRRNDFSSYLAVREASSRADRDIASLGDDLR